MTRPKKNPPKSRRTGQAKSGGTRVCETSPTKSKSAAKPRNTRRSQAEIAIVRQAVINELAALRPMTCRQLFYRLVSSGHIPKTERAYKALCRLLAQMRRDGSIHFSAIADHTRYMRRPQTYPSLQGMLHHTRETYRRALWANQDVYVEIWCEKETLAGVLYPITAQWDVPLMLCRGYPSLSFLHSAAETMDAVGKPVHLHYLGDHDPSGRDIDRFIEEQIRELAPCVDLSFTRVAVTEAQIDEFKLQTRPTKSTDSRSKGFVGESVEVDAINPAVLRGICESCILQHVDSEALKRTFVVENAERDTLQTIINNLRSAG